MIQSYLNYILRKILKKFSKKFDSFQKVNGFFQLQKPTKYNLAYYLY